jgi:hypothetical protein
MMVERPTGTVNLNVVSAAGDISSVTTTSGLAWKIRRSAIAHRRRGTVH